MNTQIKQFAELSGGTQKYVPAPGVWQFFDSELEQFVDRIIDECVGCVENDEEKQHLKTQILKKFDII